MATRQQNSRRTRGVAPAVCPVCERTVGTMPSFWFRERTPGIAGRTIRKLARHHGGNGVWCSGGGIEIEEGSNGEA